MRPRPDAAENYRSVAELIKLVDASMRPRPDAAENEDELIRRTVADNRLQ